MANPAVTSVDTSLKVLPPVTRETDSKTGEQDTAATRGTSKQPSPQDLENFRKFQSADFELRMALISGSDPKTLKDLQASRNEWETRYTGLSVPSSSNILPTITEEKPDKDTDNPFAQTDAAQKKSNPFDTQAATVGAI